WPYIDSNLTELSNVEEVRAKILYSSLKELEPEERKLLAEKYRVEQKPYIKDSVIAEKHGIKLQEYRNKRVSIEEKFQKIIEKNLEKYGDELSNAIRLDYQKISCNKGSDPS